MYRLDFHEKIHDDLLCIPQEIVKEVVGYFENIKSNPYACSLPLFGNLSACRKIYIAKAQYRIVIKIENNMAKIVQIITVGKRQDKIVYTEADQRINSQT